MKKLFFISKLLLITSLFPLFSSAQAAEPIEISFIDLQGPTEPFKDPFEVLTEFQIYNLSVYAQISEMLKVVPSSVTEEMKKQAVQAKIKLIEDKIDIEDMIKQSEIIAKVYEKSALSTNPLFANKEIKISGYMVVLELKNNLVTEFLLVGTLGACSHSAVPPANQILLVKTETPFELSSIDQAVTVSGTLHLAIQQKDLYFVDGEQSIEMAYNIEKASVKPYNQMI